MDLAMSLAQYLQGIVDHHESVRVNIEDKVLQPRQFDQSNDTEHNLLLTTGIGPGAMQKGYPSVKATKDLIGYILRVVRNDENRFTLIESGQYVIQNLAAGINRNQGIQCLFNTEAKAAAGQNQSVRKEAGGTDAKAPFPVEKDCQDIDPAHRTTRSQDYPATRTADDAGEDRRQNWVVNGDGWGNDQSCRQREYCHPETAIEDEFTADAKPAQQDQGNIQQKISKSD